MIVFRKMISPRLLLYTIIVLSLVCSSWTTARWLRLWNRQHSITTKSSPSFSQDPSWMMSSSSSSSSSRNTSRKTMKKRRRKTHASDDDEDESSWIGSVWIPPRSMMLYTTIEIQHIFSRFDSILWLGDRLSPFATLYHVLRHDNHHKQAQPSNTKTTNTMMNSTILPKDYHPTHNNNFLSRSTMINEAIVINSTTTCPSWMNTTMMNRHSSTITSSRIPYKNRTTAQRPKQSVLMPPICHYMSSTSLTAPTAIASENNGRRRQYRLDFVATSCLSHLTTALQDWFSSWDLTTTSSHPEYTTTSSLQPQQQQQQQQVSGGKSHSNILLQNDPPTNVLIVISLGCDDISHKARRRYSCDTNTTSSSQYRFPLNVWQRLDLVMKQLQDNIIMMIRKTTTTTKNKKMNQQLQPPRIVLIWKLGNYCHTHPERDYFVQVMDDRIQQGIRSLNENIIGMVHPSSQQSSSVSSSNVWEYPPNHILSVLDYGKAIRDTAHVLNVDTRLEHQFVFLQLLTHRLYQLLRP